MVRHCDMRVRVLALRVRVNGDQVVSAVHRLCELLCDIAHPLHILR